MIQRTRILIAGLFVATILPSCGKWMEALSGASPTVPASEVKPLPDLKPIDAQVYTVFPSELWALAQSGAPAGSDGLLGRNRDWGGMYSPRFQLGAGRALRLTLVAEAYEEAGLAFQAVRAGADVIQEDGRVPTVLPEEMFGGVRVRPTESEVVSAAAFFLGDACLGMIALETAVSPDLVAPVEAREAVTERLERATTWLLAQRQVLVESDRGAPNRLFFDALAFQACGVLTGNRDAVDEAVRFADRGLALYNPEGYFIEDSGWDTSYQAVAIHVANDALLAGCTERDELRTTLHGAATWLAERVDEEGRVDSSGNTRTCGGGEEFLGVPKKVSLTSVFLALAYIGVEESDNDLTEAARRVSGWVRHSPGANPCYP